ncbi:hypothetical protein [Pyxidicoccus sp. MSG2]|uniref:hypothetical protein n=1 Tax=Pyxidicoccus sp. MSG2 TaxID=2996790 RepID=UPI00226D8A68|nr:hypothetical protein [Pyxidicoccus sp. MSG2]MCY1015803.1 hypothetical protein [Pyxidicoccus sp. MSG2]
MTKRALLLAAVLAAGCGGEAKKAIEQRRMAVAQKLAKVTSIADQARALPPVKEGSLTLGAAPLVMAFLTTTPLRTGTVVYAEDLDDLSVFKDEPPHYTMRVNQAQLVQACGQLLDKGTYGQQTAANVHANVAIEYLDACANLAYVFVLRTREVKGRSFEGDVVAFDLADGKPIGGFPISFTSEGRRDQVRNTTTSVSTQRVGGRNRTTVTKTTTISTVDADSDQLRSDLDGEIEAAIVKLAPAGKWFD